MTILSLRIADNLLSDSRRRGDKESKTMNELTLVHKNACDDFHVGQRLTVEFPAKWYVRLWRLLTFYKPKPLMVAAVDYENGVIRFEVK